MDITTGNLSCTGENLERIYDTPRLNVIENDATGNSRLVNDDFKPEVNRNRNDFSSDKPHDSFYVSTFGKVLPRPTTLHVPCGKTYSRSAENLKKYEVDSLPAQNVYLDVNGYKTFFAVCDDDDCGTVAEEKGRVEQNYTWEYSTETLKALNKVTRKFDSFRMRQLKANIFNASQSSNDALEDSHKARSKNQEDISSRLFRTQTNKPTDFNKVSYAASKLLQQTNVNTPDIAEVESNYEENQRNALKISREESERIEFFYSCLDCEIYVAGCVVDVLASIRTNNTTTGWESETSPYRWVQVWVGVPVLVLDIGQVSSRPRKLTIVVAQRDTGMPLWMERVTYATDYKQLENEGLHLLTGAGNEKRSLKIRWSDWECAKIFLEHFKLLTANQNDPLWLNETKSKLNKKQTSNLELSPFKARDLKKYNPSCSEDKLTPKLKDKRSKKRDRLQNTNISNQRSKGLTKENISVPCNLRHITKVDSKDVNFRTTFAGLLPVTGKKHQYKILQDEEFRPRLPTH